AEIGGGNDSPAAQRGGRGSLGRVQQFCVHRGRKQRRLRHRDCQIRRILRGATKRNSRKICLPLPSAGRGGTVQAVSTYLEETSAALQLRDHGKQDATRPSGVWNQLAEASREDAQGQIPDLGKGHHLMQGGRNISSLK
ncbi:hypothetical protein IscW_ISCW008378, partial [Ixodes scapularis]